MFNRIANVFTFFTFGLLAAILWFGAAAIHDFNNPVYSQVFVREFDGRADYQSGDRNGDLVGYQVHYITCGNPNTTFDKLNLRNGLIEASGPQYATIEKVSSPSRQITLQFRPMERKLAFEMGIANRDDFEPIGAVAYGTRRVCRIDLRGLGEASASLIRSLT